MDASILLLAPLTLALLIALLVWTFGTSSAGPNRAGEGDGLLVEVSVLPNQEAAILLRRRLDVDGIRATISGSVGSGFRLLVFPADESAARTILSRHSLR